jgi:general secretion pathway protein G
MKLVRGFTLIELLVVVAIVAILASAARPLSELNVKRAKELELRRAPRRLEDLVQGVDDRRAGNKQRIYFLRRIPRDPMTPDGQWGLRSYASPPEAPAEGDDVFDVYTRAPGIGIDGRPYREW